MKLLTKEEEDAHYRTVLRGGSLGGALGLTAGLAATALATRRYPAFRSLTLPFKTFLVTSSGTFGAIVGADRASMAFQAAQDPTRGYQTQSARAESEVPARATAAQRFAEWGRQNRYAIVFGSWVAGMAASLAVVNRQTGLTAAQRLVQARVYAQGLTLAVLIVTAAFEMRDAQKGSGRWETVMVVDPDDPEHRHLIEKKIHKEEYHGQDLWKDMVAAEEKRLEERKKRAQAEREGTASTGKGEAA